MDQAVLGRYEIVRELETAPWGPVCEGRDTVRKCRVIIHAVRLQNLSPRAAGQFMGRLRADALCASRLLHDGIVSVLDSGRVDDVAYLVTQFVEGQALKARLDRGERVPLRIAVAMMVDLLAALQHAHAGGIVHRGVRPANILVGHGRVKLTGFGMASVQQSEVTTGAKLGTLPFATRYMSPEQVLGRPLEIRSDLFSAGVVLYELLTGTHPFEGTSAFAVIQRILTGALSAPSQMVPGLPAALDGVLARTLAKNREDRFASAGEFARALRNLAPAPARAPAAPDVGTIALQRELACWRTIKDSEGAEDFLAFLKHFPQGSFAPLAERRLRKMGQRTA